jgi:hypothetical protein
MVARWNCLALVFALTACKAAFAQHGLDDLLRWVPSSANAVMVIDAAAVHSSPLAVKEGCKDQHEAEYVKRPLILRPRGCPKVANLRSLQLQLRQQRILLFPTHLIRPFAN